MVHLKIFGDCSTLTAAIRGIGRHKLKSVSFIELDQVIWGVTWVTQVGLMPSTRLKSSRLTLITPQPLYYPKMMIACY